MIPIPPDPKIGVVIGTYGSIPFVELGLIALDAEPNRLTFSVLVHDDGSDDFGRLSEIAASWGAAACTPGRRLSKPGESMVGDMSAFAMGLEWGSVHGIDILVKFSRRWIVSRPWVDGLRELAHNTQYATYSSVDMMCGLGFRSECCALHVPSWMESGAYDKLRAQIATGEQPVHGLVGGAEGWYHELARSVHRRAHPDPNDRSDLCAYTEGHFTRSEPWSGYGMWPMMGLSRKQRIPGVLWHNSCSAADYAELARSFGLSYTEADFVVPGDAL
jgi:hypothetical protein